MTRQYNYSFEQKAKLASRKAVKEKEKEIKRLRKNLENKTIRLRAKKEALSIVHKAETDSKSKSGTVMDEGQYNVLPKPVRFIRKRKRQNSIQT